jgi:hypothetical protein
MSPRLDPALPLVWRSPNTLQLGGIRPVAVIDEPGALESALLRTLAAGASRSTLHTIGAAFGGDGERVDALLDHLEPAFVGEPTPAASGVVALAGPSELVDDLGTALLRLGHRPVTAADADPATTDAAVLLAARVVPPASYLRWLAADVPHLAVVLDERGAEIGPFVRPGSGPCVRCLHLARRDGDAAWPAIAAQLAVAEAPPHRGRARHEALALAASVVDDLLRAGRTALDAATVVVSDAPVPASPRPSPIGMHPECGCRAPGGSATVPVPIAARRPTARSSARAVAVPA